MSRSPTLIEAVRRAINAQLADVRVSMPARVERYDRALQQVDVQVLIKDAYTDEEGARVVEPLPVIACVPVCFPGAGSYRLTFPIAVGDTVLVVFGTGSLDVWLSQGGLVDPLDDRRFSLADAVAIPGLRDFGHPLVGDGTGAPDDALTLGHDTGAQVRVEQAAVRLNTAAGQLVALANKVEAELDALRTHAASHTHTCPAGTSAVAAPAPGAVGSVGAAGVYAKE